MKTQDFFFELPKDLIAQTPLDDRAQSRLMIINKATGAVTHTRFTEIINYLQPGDCLVLNDTKVLPARLMGETSDTGAGVELLLLSRKALDVWEVLVKPGKRAKAGREIVFGNGKLKAVVEEVLDNGNRLVRFDYNKDATFEAILDQLGEMPLPPYIHEKLADKSRLQTVYAKHEGSAAAPTAGLHFTHEILEGIKKLGVSLAYVTLHVGLGTFRPVKVDNIDEHVMHNEFYSLDKEQADIINAAKKSGGRVIAVGTTSCRTLETVADDRGNVTASSGYTGIFIYPGYQFKVVDGMVTNFHLPESTLIMLVSALAGRENVLRAYEEAIEKRYRFYSLGDCCLVI